MLRAMKTERSFLVSGPGSSPPPPAPPVLLKGAWKSRCECPPSAPPRPHCGAAGFPSDLRAPRASLHLTLPPLSSPVSPGGKTPGPPD